MPGPAADDERAGASAAVATAAPAAAAAAERPATGNAAAGTDAVAADALAAQAADATVRQPGSGRRTSDAHGCLITAACGRGPAHHNHTSRHCRAGAAARGAQEARGEQCALAARLLGARLPPLVGRCLRAPRRPRPGCRQHVTTPPFAGCPCGRERHLALLSALKDSSLPLVVSAGQSSHAVAATTAAARMQRLCNYACGWRHATVCRGGLPDSGA